MCRSLYCWVSTCQPVSVPAGFDFELFERVCVRQCSMSNVLEDYKTRQRAGFELLCKLEPFDALPPTPRTCFHVSLQNNKDARNGEGHVTLLEAAGSGSPRPTKSSPGQNLDKTREGHSVSGLLFWQENIEVPRDMRRDDPHSVGKVMRDLLAAGWLRVERTTRVEAAGGTRCEVALS